MGSKIIVVVIMIHVRLMPLYFVIINQMERRNVVRPIKFVSMVNVSQAAVQLVVTLTMGVNAKIFQVLLWLVVGIVV